ncbi:hypothetical protein C8J57DRAFT_1465105 [Mycena rebaudengoi]|nr:hypothetical protein C8J57DRAFT_1465105 [Mycena rebaudengoi]
MGEIIADFNRCQAQLLRGQFPSIAGPLESLVELERTHFTHISTLSYDLSCFDKKFNTESQPPSDIPGFQLYLENAVASIQRSLWYYIQEPHPDSSSHEVASEMYDRTLDAVLSLPLSPASLSVTALVKSTLLGQLVNTLYWRNHERGISESTLLAYSDHPLPAQETMTQLPAWLIETADDAIISQSQYEPLAEILFQRTTEGRFVLLTEFLEFCNTSGLPFEAAETLEYLGFFLGIEPNGFHVKQQIRFASSVQNAFTWDHPHELLYGIIKLGVWRGEAIRWLNDPSSRQMIRDSFAAYVEKYPSDGPSNVRERVQDIVRVLDNRIPSSNYLK